MKTSICTLLDIEAPIFAFSHCRDVVSEVSRAGGFGVLGIAGFTAEQLEQELSWIDQHIGDKCYGVDLLIPGQRIEEADFTKLEAMIPQPHKDFMQGLVEKYKLPELPADHEGHFSRIEDSSIIGDRPYEMLAIALKHPKVRLYVNALGTPSPRIMDMCKTAGIKVAAMAGKVKHAIKHKDAGVDLIIAVGGEAAGHTGDISTMVLTPQVVDAVSPTPVLAAGGIASGRQIAAALALGAEGVWTGSVWLPTQESELSSMQRKKILDAESDETVRSRSMTGKPVRMIVSEFTHVWESDEAPKPLPFPLQIILTRDVVERVEKNNIEEMVTYPAGQVIGLLKQETSVRQVMQEMLEDYLRCCERINETLDY